MTSTTTTTMLLATLLGQTVYAQLQQTCYWPNGEISGYQPCSDRGGACCYHYTDTNRDACYSNGICHSLYFGYFYRGACTDKSWGSGCPNICKHVDNDSMSLRFCKPMDAWCCQPNDSTGDCCSEGVGFQWLNATQVNYKVEPVDSSFEYDLADAFTTTTATSLAASSPSTSGTASTLSSSSSSSSTTAAITGSLNGTNASECSENTSANIALGAGLGLGLGIPLLAALAALLWLGAKQRAYKQFGIPRPGYHNPHDNDDGHGGQGAGNWSEYTRQQNVGGVGYSDSQSYVKPELGGQQVSELAVPS